MTCGSAAPCPIGLWFSTSGRRSPMAPLRRCAASLACRKPTSVAGELRRMLKVDKIDTNYGVVAMLRDVSFEVAQGEFVCVLGPNGAGKTTTFRALSGLLPLARGRIELMGLDLAGLQTESLSALGIGFVPEGRRLFAEISVRDNIALGFERRKAKPT